MASRSMFLDRLVNEWLAKVQPVNIIILGQQPPALVCLNCTCGAKTGVTSQNRRKVRGIRADSKQTHAEIERHAGSKREAVLVYYIVL